MQQAVARNPRNAPLKADLIRIEAEMSGVDAAIAKARALAKEDPDNDIYDLVSAELYEKAGRTGEALTLLEKAVAAKPSDDGLIIGLSRLYTRAGNFPKAEETLTRRLQADPNDTGAASALASLYRTTGRLADAKKVLDGMLAKRPNDVPVLLGLAEMATTDKKWPEATDYIERARAASPSDPAPGIALVNLYGLRQDWKAAALAAAELVEKFPTNPDVLDAKGRVQIASGDAQGAISTYKQVYQLAPNSAPVLSRYLGALNAAKAYTEERSRLAGRDHSVRPKNNSLKDRFDPRRGRDRRGGGGSCKGARLRQERTGKSALRCRLGRASGEGGTQGRRGGSARKGCRLAAGEMRV